LGDTTLSDRRRQSQPLTLAILDLDHFKAIHDTYGHDIGDTVLRAFCTHVSQQVRPSHMLGRLGGEEFLPGTSLVDAEVVVQRVRRTLKSHAGVRYTFSAGMAQAGAPGTGSGQLQGNSPRQGCTEVGWGRSPEAWYRGAAMNAAFERPNK
jgi:diguanylate cyclase (GGDEF)-like protein